MYSSNMDLLLVSIFIWIFQKLPLQIFLHEDSAAASSPVRIGSVQSVCPIWGSAIVIFSSVPDFITAFITFIFRAWNSYVNCHTTLLLL